MRLLEAIILSASLINGVLVVRVITCIKLHEL